MASEEYEREIQVWRQSRLTRLTAPDGWLSLIGKTFLEPRVPLAIGSAAADGGISLPAGAPAELGTVELQAKSVRFTPAGQTVVRIKRAGIPQPEPLTGAVELTSDARGPSDRLFYGDLVLDVMERGDQFAVRVRDVSRAHPEFAAIEYFPIDPAWRLTAKLEPYQPEKAIDLVYESGTEQAYYSPGALVFEKDGVEHRLDPVFESDRKRLWIVFADPTNRDSSYGAGRFLYAALPKDGQVTLDFNQAFSPPCAFSPFVACPLPPFQNRLKVRVEAGEKRPADHA
ncbi:MAG TPA: DUF1684 domain-containing protein [Polyangiales bacterium]|nr:DUF1684 domain-containing protein [Polyangiales bacterium]